MKIVKSMNRGLFCTTGKLYGKLNSLHWCSMPTHLLLMFFFYPCPAHIENDTISGNDVSEESTERAEHMETWTYICSGGI